MNCRMSDLSTIVLLPFLAAIATYLGIFYARERATSKRSPNFILGCVSILGFASYLLLRVLEMVSATGTIVYAVVGGLLLVWAIISTRL